MRYPAFLSLNDTISFISPSFGAVLEPYHTAFQASLDKWNELGFQTELGPNVYENSGIGISSTPERCGRELTEYYLKADSQALITTGGGELMCEILDYVDFERIKKATPKWYMGYSDNTNFTFLLPTLCDTAAIYGPCAPAFGMQPWHASIYDAFEFLTGGLHVKPVKKLKVHGYPLWEKESLKDEEHPLEPYHVTEKTVVKSFFWDGSPISGRLIGGCMDCLVNLTGTVYDRAAAFAERYQEDGIIWFLEACDLNVYAIRRAMWQMKHAGWFRHVKAFLIGRPLVMGQELFGLDQYRAVTDVVQDLHVPVIMDIDLGHLPPMMPFISGGYGTVSPYRRNQIQIEYVLR